MDKGLASLIEINPEIMVGKPVIKGTQISVELILESLAAGSTIEDILDSYPHINRQQIMVAIKFVSEAFKSEQFHLFIRWNLLPMKMLKLINLFPHNALTFHLCPYPRF